MVFIYFYLIYAVLIPLLQTLRRKVRYNLAFLRFHSPSSFDSYENCCFFSSATIYIYMCVCRRDIYTMLQAIYIHCNFEFYQPNIGRKGMERKKDNKIMRVFIARANSIAVQRLICFVFCIRVHRRHICVHCLRC